MSIRSTGLLLLIVFLLNGCANLNIPTKDPGDETWPIDRQALNQGAKPCDKPRVAHQKLDSEFKYGCFCGKGHPDLNHASGRAGRNLSNSERAELVAAYLSIKPYDDIDVACQSHDICWVRHGQSEISCNARFRKEMDDLSKVWNDRRSLFDTKSLDFRCQWLARDLGFAAGTVMEGVSESHGEATSNNLKKFFTAPITVMYSLTVVMGGWGGKSYPFGNERCLGAQQVINGIE